MRTHHINWLLLVYRLIRVSLGIIFVWSGISKLQAPEYFSVIIESYGLIPEELNLPVALCLSWVELLAGLGLISDIYWCLGIITGLLVLFMVIISYGLWLGLDVDCGCFGPQTTESKAFHSLRPTLYRDIVMFTSTIFLYYLRYKGAVQPFKLFPIIQRIVKRR